MVIAQQLQEKLAELRRRHAKLVERAEKAARSAAEIQHQVTALEVVIRDVLEISDADPSAPTPGVPRRVSKAERLTVATAVRHVVTSLDGEFDGDRVCRAVRECFPDQLGQVQTVQVMKTLSRLAREGEIALATQGGPKNPSTYRNPNAVTESDHESNLSDAPNAVQPASFQIRAAAG